MRSATWIVGRGGLLGSAMSRAAAADQVHVALSWQRPELAAQFQRGAQALASMVRRGQTRWEVCWCAGSGVVGSDQRLLAGETLALRQLLEALLAEPELRRCPGTFGLSSSAGGVYAGCGELRISEATPTRAISDYGSAKLEQERLLREMSARFEAMATLTARFSNLYGPEQRLDKPQGLISHMARAVVAGQPVRIYVPLDTMRDYLFADDAASMFRAGLERLRGAREPLHVEKIYASERDTSIASLLGIFRQVAKRRLLVVSGLHATSAQQPRRLSFRSRVWPDDRSLSRTDLLAGIAVVFQRRLGAYTAAGAAT